MTQSFDTTIQTQETQANEALDSAVLLSNTQSDTPQPQRLIYLHLSNSGRRMQGSDLPTDAA